MKIAADRVLDRLPAEEPCLGALFTSYSFDPNFFENHVIRAVLRLTSDPVEHAERYHHEARRALQETPVVAVVDAAERRAGRRLPFDLLEVSATVFHPKSALLLYREHARFLIGSGNLTLSGYGGNTELFLCIDLQYDEQADAALLQAFSHHLSRIRSLVRKPGTQFDLFCDELNRRLSPTTPNPQSAHLAFLDSTIEPIVEQFAALLPKNAVIDYIGMLAPFYERDDGAELDVTSVLGVLDPRTDKDTVLDVGVAWDNPQVYPSGESELENGLGRIWTRSYEEGGERSLEHFVPDSVGPSTLSLIDGTAQRRRWALDKVREDIAQSILWIQPQPIAFAPRNTIAAATKRFSEVRLWLHPSTRLIEGKPLYKPLHAKLLMVGYRSSRSRGTLILMGSPNMSRRALLMRAGPGQGNVETALAFRLDSRVLLHHFLPELTYAPVSALDLQEREFPELERNYALAIEEAIHDPTARTLVISWSAQAADIPAWSLTYAGEQLASSPTPPASPITVAEFDLKASTAEVILHVPGSEYPVPILVTDLATLPTTAHASALGLSELLMFLGRRTSVEQIAYMAKLRGERIDNADELKAFFSERFAPSDVFRAWWAVAQDLGDPLLSVPAFRLRIDGTLGVHAAWKCMFDAAHQHEIPAEEVWLYGAELQRELSQIELPDSHDRQAKSMIMGRFRETLQKDLCQIMSNIPTRHWVKHIFTFYGEGSK